MRANPDVVVLVRNALDNLREAIVRLLVLVPEVLAELKVFDVVEKGPQDAVREAVVVSLCSV